MSASYPILQEGKEGSERWYALAKSVNRLGLELRTWPWFSWTPSLMLLLVTQDTLCCNNWRKGII